MKKQQFGEPPDLKPIFGEEVLVNSNIKVNKEEKDGDEKIRKHGKVTLNFFQKKGGKVVAKIVVDPLTARKLGKILLKNTRRLFEELDKEGIPDKLEKRIKKRKKELKDNELTGTTGSAYG